MKFTLGFIPILISFSAAAMPAKVIIIRHAEKAANGNTLSEGVTNGQKHWSIFSGTTLR